MARFNELPAEEQLTIGYALWKQLGKAMSAKDPDSLRSYMDAQLVENYRATGYKSKDVRINNEKCGTFSVRVGRGRPERTETRLYVRDPYALDAYVAGDGATLAAEYVHMVSQNFAEWLLSTHGEVCPGCEVINETIPATEGEVLGTTLRIDAEKVAEACAGYLPTTVAGLLGGEADA